MIRKGVILLGVLTQGMILGQMIFAPLGSYLLHSYLLFALLFFLSGQTFKLSKDFGYFILFMIPYLIFGLIQINTYANVFNDLSNAIFVVPFSLLFFSLIKDEEDFDFYMKYLCMLFFTIGIIFSILGFYKLLALSQGKLLSWVDYSAKTSLQGTSLIGDYNVFASGLAVCAFAASYFYTKIDNKLLLFLLYLTPIIILAAAVMSGSRRSIFYVPIFILFYMNRGISTNALYKRIRTLIIAVVLVFIVVVNADSIIKVFGINVDSESVFSVFERQTSTFEDNTAVNPRSSRWAYAFDLYSDYNIFQIIFGNGFEYLQKFKVEFFSTSEDYPHNYLLSALLYGGIIGVLFSLVLTVKSFYKLLKGSEFFKVPLAWFCIIILTNMLSGNSLLTLNFSIFIFLFPLCLNIFKTQNRIINT